jgi:hypothetical protein
MRKFAIAAAVAAATISSAALALVTVDSNGYGFVGKGDVQLAFGWNNAAAQRNATAVSFHMQSSASYEAVCTFTTGEGTRGERTHNVEHKRSTAVLSTIASDPRKTGQWTGYNLNGFGAVTTTGGPVPEVGGACMGNAGHDGVWSSVTELGSTGNGLFVTYNGVSVQIG